MVWQATNLTKDKHCFFGRNGGVSEGKYASLNVNTRSCDSVNNLNKNLDIAAAVIGLKKEDLLLLSQGVSDNVVYVQKASRDEIEADGVVTNKSNIGLCIRTADCVPILFEDRVNGVIGAAHAGWRGAYKGIIANVVKLMLEKGAKAKHIAVGVGPCIAQKSYEVDAFFYKQFVEEDSAFVKYFKNSNKEGFYLFDLQSFCVDRICEEGINNIKVSNHDTYALKEEYFSFRRFTHQGIVDKPKDFATELSVIVL